MDKWFFALIQFFPLSVFAAFAYWEGIPSNERWLEAFQLGALLGVFQLVIMLSRKEPLNRLVLAGNLYLILGGLAVLLQQWWYLQLYDSLREFAIILSMAFVGGFTTFCSGYGFIAVKGSARVLSVYLFLATVAMLPFAIIFQGNRIYSAVLPILFLAILQRYLAYVAKQKR